MAVMCLPDVCFIADRVWRGHGIGGAETGNYGVYGLEDYDVVFVGYPNW